MRGIHPICQPQSYYAAGGVMGINGMQMMRYPDSCMPGARRPP